MSAAGVCHQDSQDTRKLPSVFRGGSGIKNANERPLCSNVAHNGEKGAQKHGPMAFRIII